MIPLKDNNPTRTVPFVTLLLIGACVAVYFLVQPAGKFNLVEADAEEQQVREIRFLLDKAAIPKEMTTGRPLTEEEVSETIPALGGPSSVVLCPPEPDPACYPDKNVWLAGLYSMFLHGGLMHLAGNMLFLWIFGNNIEERKGRVAYLAFYLLAGVAATAAHVLVDTGSTNPVVGASGAIAGVMGAYLVLYPNVRIHTLLFLGFLVMFRDIQAKWLLLFWLATQFLVAPNSDVAYMAHVGGFVFGVAAGFLWRAVSPSDRPRYWDAERSF